METETPRPEDEPTSDTPEAPEAPTEPVDPEADDVPTDEPEPALPAG